MFKIKYSYLYGRSVLIIVFKVLNSKYIFVWFCIPNIQILKH